MKHYHSAVKQVSVPVPASVSARTINEERVNNVKTVVVKE